MLAVGAAAPDFTLQDQDERPVSLRAALATGPVVLFFYPADFTPVCTREVCLVRDTHAELARAGITVLGVSADDVATHGRFRERHALPYSLLADPEKRVMRAYGVEGPLGIVRRATFLIGSDAVIRDAVLADLRLGRHEALLRRALE
jgi:thioredoxin-dependent peroxiredoxin